MTSTSRPRVLFILGNNNHNTMLHQVAQAEELAHKQRLREQALADIGSLRRLPPMGL